MYDLSQIHVHLRSANEGVELAFKTAIGKRDVTMSLKNATILLLLADRGPMTAGAIADSVGTVATGFTQTLDKLESAGLVNRGSHPTDRRALLIHLKGSEELIKNIRDALEEALEQFGFSPDEWKTLVALLKKLSE